MNLIFFLFNLTRKILISKIKIIYKLGTPNLSFIGSVED